MKLHDASFFRYFHMIDKFFRIIHTRKIGRISMTMMNELIYKSVPDKNRQTYNRLHIYHLIYLKNFENVI